MQIPQEVLWGGGTTPTKQNIEYGIIASLGNNVNFGDLTIATTCRDGSSPTRAMGWWISEILAW